MKQPELACVLTIAGTDPSGGAGIQADIKAISATGAYAASVITALVSQNTQGVQAIEDVRADFVRQQLESVFSDLHVKAVKIGMLHDERIIEVISKALSDFKPGNIVFDPVMVAKDGSKLLRLPLVSMLKEKILHLTDLITPNLYEAQQLVQRELRDRQAMQAAAIELGTDYGISVLIKGGHLDSVFASDVLYDHRQETCFWYEERKIHTNHTHGTGCTLSSAIASYLGQGLTLVQAINAAKQYITKAIQSGQHFSLGKGNGPVDHFYCLRKPTS